MAAVQQRISLEEFLRLPEEKTALEYQDGMVTQKVSPKARHSVLQGWFCQAINQSAAQRRIAFAFPELRITLAGVSRVPDVAIFRWSRLPLDDRGELIDDVLIPPDVAIEILSPEQNARQEARRCQWYVEHGVALTLLVNEQRRTVTAFRPGQPPQVLSGSDVVDFAPVLPEFRVTVDELFGALRFA